MTMIRSRKHPARRRGQAPALLKAAGVLTSVAFALPAAAADVAAESAPIAQVADARSLAGVTVEGVADPYRVRQLSSPKFTEPLLDTPQTISVIDQELLHQQGATTLTEALRNSPGVGTFYAGENGTSSTGDAIFMRGFDSSGSIFVDGVRDLGTVARDVFNVEQVEVTKGPDGTEYGRTAPTGAVNLVSKQPQLVDATSGSLSAGSGPARRLTADWNRQTGAHAALRLNVMAQDSGVAGRERVANRRWGVAPALAFGLGTPLRVYLDYLHIAQHNIPDGAVPTIGLPGYSSPDPSRPFIATAPAVDPRNFYGTRQDHDRVRSDLFTAIVMADIGQNVAFHDTLRWGQTRQDYLLTAFVANAANFSTPDPADPATWTVARSHPTFKDQTNRILTNQANVTAQFASGIVNHSLSAGIELTRETATALGRVPAAGSGWPAFALYRPDADVEGVLPVRNGADARGKTTTSAVYVFDTVKLGEHWQLNAGARLDHYTTRFRNAAECGGRRGPACGALPEGTVVPDVADEVTANLPNYKLGILWKPTAHGSLYVNFARSQEPPGGNTLAFSSAANSLDNPHLDPQNARTAEVGAKWEVLGEKLLLTAALYRTTVDNLLMQDPVDPTRYDQVGRQRVEGVELGMVGSLSERWAVSAGYTTMDAKVVKGADVAADGSDKLAYTPRAAFTAWTTYRLPFNLMVGGGARHAAGLRRGTDGAIGTPAHTSGYWVFDAMASWGMTQALDLQLNVYNLLDRNYVASINKSGYRYIPGIPRSALLTLNFRF